MKLCKNGCNLPRYKNRTICMECIKKEVRENYQVKKDVYNQARRKPKKIGFCEYCKKKFETIKPNQKFCCTRHKELFWYEKKTMYQKTRDKARLRVYNRGVKLHNSKKYTKQEEKFIVKNYKKLTNIEIAKILGKTVNGITLKIRSLKNELKIIEKDFF